MGKTVTCENCTETYETRYSTKEEAKAADDPIGVEQHIEPMNICSRRCYLDYIGSLVESVDEFWSRINGLPGVDSYFIGIEEVDSDTGEIEEVLEGQLTLVDDEIVIDGETYTEDEIQEYLDEYLVYISL